MGYKERNLEPGEFIFDNYYVEIKEGAQCLY